MLFAGVAYKGHGDVGGVVYEECPCMGRAGLWVLRDACLPPFASFPMGRRTRVTGGGALDGTSLLLGVVHEGVYYCVSVGCCLIVFVLSVFVRRAFGAVRV